MISATPTLRHSHTPPPSPSVLFSRSGGGLPGWDIHQGIWNALEEHGIRSTANVGTSMGAGVAALDSAGKSPADCETLLRSLTDDDIRDERTLWWLRLPWLKPFYFMLPDKIQALLQRELPADFSALAKPLQVFATSEWSATSWAIGQGPLVPALMSSTAIPLVFPPVNGFCDGGLTADLPLPLDWRTYDKIYLLVAKRPLDYPKKGGILTEAMMMIDIFMTDQVRRTIQMVQAERPDAVVIWPQVRTYTGALHFNHQLINDAYILTQNILCAQDAKSIHLRQGCGGQVAQRESGA